MRMRPRVYFPLDARQLSQSTTICPDQGKRHAGPGEPARPSWTHLELIPRTSSNMTFPRQRISTYTSFIRLARVHIQKLLTPR